jgi:hypothetical protein
MNDYLTKLIELSKLEAGFIENDKSSIKDNYIFTVYYNGFIHSFSLTENMLDKFDYNLDISLDSLRKSQGEFVTKPVIIMRHPTINMFSIIPYEYDNRTTNNPG